MVLSTVQGVMGLDSLESSHPISIVVNHPDEISEIFDGISYSKGKNDHIKKIFLHINFKKFRICYVAGASIIRMLASFLGDKTFRQGLTNYLNSK